jgi:TonB-linked SusC/RagA family outer membrane protein
MTKRKSGWILLLFFLLLQAGSLYGQETKQQAAKAEQNPLDLLFRTIDGADFNGSAYTISGEDIRNIPVTSLTNVLGGIIPGFFSRQSEGGMVNESASVWIRGTRTYSEGVLVLVDGQERDFGILSPHEIESITVLKDAAGTVLYGMRGANGVILVNTRKGVAGKPTIEFSEQLIHQQPFTILDPLSFSEYAEHYNTALKNDGLDETRMYSRYYLSHYGDRTGVDNELYPEINWIDSYYKTSTWLNRYNMNISGGSDRTRYFVNAGLLTQSGMFETDNEFDYNTNNNIKRYNVRSNVDFDVTATTLFSVDLYGWYEKQNRPGGDSWEAYNALSLAAPNSFPDYFADDGTYTDQSGNAITGINGKIIAGDGIHTNPWALLNMSGYSTLGKIYGSFRSQLIQDMSAITKGLKASVILSMDSYAQAVTDRTKSYAYYQIIDPENPATLKKTGVDGKMANDVTSRDSYRRTSLDVQLSYDRQLGFHGLNAMVFYNQYEYANEISVPNRFQGTGAWLGYNYAKRYGIDVMMSYQGAYKFAPGQRFGFFPTAAAGWTISNEPFFIGLEKYIQYLKVKASYGHIGSHRGVSEFRFMGRLNPTSAIYNFGNAMGGAAGYVEDIIANPGITWEKSEISNIGIEARFLRNRLSVSAEMFRDNRTDMYISNNRISSLLGTVAAVEENIGEMYSEGYDLAAIWRSGKGKAGFTLGGTYSFSKNKVTRAGEADQPYPWLQTAGYAKGVKRGYIAEGFFQSYEEIAAAPVHTFSEVKPGDLRYRDINNDGIINTDDRVPIGYSDIPQVFCGITASISFKGFSVNSLFQGAYAVSRTVAGRLAYPFLKNGNIYSHQTDFWSPENQTAKLPGISTINSGGVNNTQISTFWVRNADYMRLKMLELVYDFPETLLKDSFVKNIRLFASGYNLFTWTDFDSPLHPEEEADAAGMPLTRNVSIGCSIKF